MPFTDRDLDAVEAAERLERSLESDIELANKISEQHTDLARAAEAFLPYKEFSDKLTALAADMGLPDVEGALGKWATEQVTLLDGIAAEAAKAAGANLISGAVADNAISNVIENVFDGILPAQEIKDALAASELTEGAFGPSFEVTGALDAMGLGSISEDVVSSVARLRTEGVVWDDVLAARAGFVSTLDELHVQDPATDDGETIDLAETAPALPVQEPWTRAEKIALAGVLLTAIFGTTTLLLMFLASQESIVRNARYDAHLMQRAVDQLIDYLAKLVVWYGELPRA